MPTSEATAYADVTFEAVVFDWAITAGSDRPTYADAVRARIEGLCAAAVHVFVFCDSTADEVDRLPSRSAGPGRLHQCGSRLGLGAVRWPHGWPTVGSRAASFSSSVTSSVRSGSLAGRDSSLLVPELARARVVSVGVEVGGVPPGVHHLGGGCERLLEILDDQLARRSTRRVPWIDEDPAWVVPLPAEPAWTCRRGVRNARQRVGRGQGLAGRGRAGAAPLFAGTDSTREAPPRDC